MDYVGSPVSEEIKARFEKLRFEDDKQRAVQEAQKLLDPLCLLVVDINPESRVKVARGTAAPEFYQPSALYGITPGTGHDDDDVWGLR